MYWKSTRRSDKWILLRMMFWKTRLFPTIGLRGNLLNLIIGSVHSNTASMEWPEDSVLNRIVRPGWITEFNFRVWQYYSVRLLLRYWVHNVVFVLLSYRKVTVIILEYISSIWSSYLSRSTPQPPQLIPWLVAPSVKKFLVFVNKVSRIKNKHRYNNDVVIYACIKLEYKNKLVVKHKKVFSNFLLKK